MSLPNYVAILTGVPPRVSGVRSNAVHGPVPLESVLSLARAHALQTRYLTEFGRGAGDLFASVLADAASVPWPGVFERMLAAALAKLPAPRHSFGRTLVEGLNVPATTAAALAIADAARERALESVADRAAWARTERAWTHRLVRATVAAAAIALLGLAVHRLGRRGTIVLDLRVLLVAVPIFPLTFHGLLAVFEPFLSPPMVPEEGDVTGQLLRYGAVAAAVDMLALWLAGAWRADLRERLAAATGVVTVGMLLALAAAAVAWVATAPPYPVQVPGPRLMMVPPVAFAGVACYAASAAVALAAEWTIFAARASSRQGPQHHEALPTEESA